MPGARAGDLRSRLRSGSHPKDLTGKPMGRAGRAELSERHGFMFIILSV